MIIRPLEKATNLSKVTSIFNGEKAAAFLAFGLSDVLFIERTCFVKVSLPSSEVDFPLSYRSQSRKILFQVIQDWASCTKVTLTTSYKKVNAQVASPNCYKKIIYLFLFHWGPGSRGGTVSFIFLDWIPTKARMLTHVLEKSGKQACCLIYLPYYLQTKRCRKIY